MGQMKTDKERLYDDIVQNGASRGIEFSDLGEYMAVGKQVIRQYWKPRFLIDHRNRTAVEFMNKNEMLLTLDHDEIMWETLAFAGKKVLARAEDLSFHFLRLSTDIKMVWQKWNGSSIPTGCTTLTRTASA